MKLLATIREKDIDPSREQLPDEAHIETRWTAKIVLFDNEGKIALVHFPPAPPQFSGDQYALPGGGVEDGESVMEALHREAMEETGCRVKDIAEIGYIVEYMRDRLLKQQSHIFLAKLEGEKGKPQWTEKERLRNMGVIWVLPVDAEKMIFANQTKSFSQNRALIVLLEIKKLLSANSTE